MFVIGIAVGLYVLVAVMAQKRNRSVVVWVLLSLLATPLLMIIILLAIGKNENYIENHYDCIMCVKVGKVKMENPYEMTRKYWKVDINRARKATHVLAIVNGIVEEVYNPVDWKYTENPKHIGRCEFLGVYIV